MRHLMEAWTWVKANPGLVGVTIAVLIGCLNAVTRHWSEHRGVVRWCLFLTEILSVFTSKGASLLGPCKPPFLSVPPAPSGLKPGDKL